MREFWIGYGEFTTVWVAGLMLGSLKRDLYDWMPRKARWCLLVACIAIYVLIPKR